MITIQDVLNRPAFSQAFVAAGCGGLTRPVHWVHVGEIPNIGDFLQGHELVLSTGVGLKTHDARSRFIHGLVGADAAGLVLELGQYLGEVPPDMVELADEAGFPIIAFRHPVRFLDLSQEIDSLVISRHHQMLEDLQTLSLRIRRALVNTDGSTRLVQLLHESLDRPVYYRLRDPVVPPINFGDWPKPPAPAADAAISPVTEKQHVRQTVMVFGDPIGDVFVAGSAEPVDERLYLALDSTVAALAQDFIRVESLDRSHRREEAALLEHLLFEETPEPYLCQRFRGRYRLTPGSAYRVLILEPPLPASVNQVRTNLRASLITAELSRSDRIIMVVVGPKPRVQGLLEALNRIPLPSRAGFCAGLSGLYDDPADMHDALSEANDALTVGRLINTPLASYDAMGIWRWIISTPHRHLTRLLIEPEIGRLLERPDAVRLLETLEALLTHIESKQAASEALGIHRQTLYARMKVLSSILGDDFLSSPRRVAVETAVIAHRYLYGNDPFPLTD